MSSSEANGGPLSVDSNVGGAYWEMSSSRCAHRDWALLDVTLYTKGYCAEGNADYEILMTFMSHVICHDVLPGAIRYVPR